MLPRFTPLKAGDPVVVIPPRAERISIWRLVKAREREYNTGLCNTIGLRKHAIIINRDDWPLLLALRLGPGPSVRCSCGWGSRVGSDSMARESPCARLIPSYGGRALHIYNFTCMQDEAFIIRRCLSRQGEIFFFSLLDRQAQACLFHLACQPRCSPRITVFCVSRGSAGTPIS